MHQCSPYCAVNLHRTGDLLRQECTAKTREDRAGAEANACQCCSVSCSPWSKLVRISKYIEHLDCMWSLQVGKHVLPHAFLLCHCVCEECRRRLCRHRSWDTRRRCSARSARHHAISSQCAACSQWVMCTSFARSVVVDTACCARRCVCAFEREFSATHENAISRDKFSSVIRQHRNRNSDVTGLAQRCIRSAEASTSSHHTCSDPAAYHHPRRARG